MFTNCTHSELPAGLISRLSQNQVSALTFSPDGTKIAAGGEGRIWIYRLDTGAQFAMLSGHPARVRALAFAPDNRRLASGYGDNALWLWDTDTAREIALLAGHSAMVDTLAVTPDGMPIPAWDEVLPTFTEAPGRIRALTFASDSVLASGNTDGKIRLWNLDTGFSIHTLAAHDGLVSALAFSTDGKTLASGSSDTTVRLWNTENGELLATLIGHTDSVHAVAFSPAFSPAFSHDGAHLATGGKDRQVRMWELLSLAARSEPEAAHERASVAMSKLAVQASAIRALTFTADGQQLMSANHDGTLYFWNA